MHMLEIKINKKVMSSKKATGCRDFFSNNKKRKHLNKLPSVAVEYFSHFWKYQRNPYQAFPYPQTQELS